MMNVLFFDAKQSDKDFFAKTKLNITYFDKNINDSIKMLKEDSFNAWGISVFANSQINKEILKKFTNLQAIFCRSVGYSHVDIKYCKENNILVYTTPHYGDHTVAEYTFAILQNLIRHVSKSNEDLKQGIVNYKLSQGIELFQKTIGIIGLGAIGSCVAKIAKGYEMEIVAFDPFAQSTHGFVKFLPLNELLKKSDFISLNAPLTKNTYHILNKKNLKLIKKDAYIVNTSRGELVETEALYNILKTNNLKGAALDVVECENGFCANSFNNLSEDECIEECLKNTYLNNKLIQLPNVIITPHIAYNTKEANDRILKITKENMFYFLENNLKNEITHIN